MLLLVFFLLVQSALVAAKKQGDFCFPEGAVTEHVNGPGFTFWKCVQGKWNLLKCPPGYQFDKARNGCVFNPITLPTVRPTSPTFCRPGSRREYIFDNTKFQECNSNGSGYILKSCNKGEVFNSFYLTCTSIGGTTWATTTRRYTTTTPYTTTVEYGPCKESPGAAGYKADRYHCDRFYQCASGVWVQQNCPAGTVWSQHILTCDHNRGQCKPHPKPTNRPTIGPPAPPTYYPPNNNGGGPIEV